MDDEEAGLRLEHLASQVAGTAVAAAAVVELARGGRGAWATRSARLTADGITNVQTAGVDEGGIVKRAGDFLVVLRRGRLFTVRVGGDALAPVAMTDAYAPAPTRAAPGTTSCWCRARRWSWSATATRAAAPRSACSSWTRDGGLSYRATYHLRSFDYYSARNYASRLIGRQLVFYSPTLLQPGGPHAAADDARPAALDRRRGGTLPTPAGSASCRPRASTAATTTSTRRSRWRCTPSRAANSVRPRWTATRPPCSARRAGCSTCRRARSTCGRPAAPPDGPNRIRRSSACRWTAARPPA
jgi:hypothetical protein